LIIIANGEVIAKKIIVEAADESKRKGGISISIESMLQKAKQ
jgi:hypothetical protein